jgi:subtilisin family serine protease
MDEIQLKRGNREVTFSKIPDTFAVRLKQGRATNEAALEASLGRPIVEVRHVDSATPEKMEIFAVEEAAAMEETVDELRKSPSADVVSHVYTLDETPGGAVIPTGTMTIQFKPNVAKIKQEELLAEFGLEVVEDLDFLPNGYTVRLTQASPENPLKIAAKLQQRAEIEVAEPDLSFQVSLKYVPTASLYQEQWHLRNRGDRLGLAAGADVKAEEAWEYTRGKREITICIIDDGFDLGHPKFNVSGKIIAPRDFGQNDFDPNPGFANDNHGTACAGVALAEDNGVGVVGLAPDCALMPVRMSEWLSDNAVVDYFRYAIEHGADVISCSWSAEAWNFPLSVKMQAIIHQAATEGRSNRKGCVILFAAGNETRPLDGVKDGQISHQGFALHPDVIAVAASNSFDKGAWYSNYGPEITICAPSSGYPGRSIVTTDRRGQSGYTSGDYTFSFGGTSSATPLAAGLAALILSANSDLTSSEVREIMMETADKIDEANGQYVNGHSPFYGHGRINAHRALQRVLELSTDIEEPEENGADNGETVLDILAVRLSRIGPSSGFPERRLMAEVRLKISGTGAEALAADQVPFRIDISTRDLEGVVPHRLVASKQGQLQPHVFEYASQLEFPIPEVGRYELESVVRLLPPADLMASHRGPIINIVP